MKKLTTLILASLLFAVVFANPKIPKIDNYFKSVHPLPKDDFLLFCSNSGQNVYKLFSVVNDKEYNFYFDNISYVTGITISLYISFSSETDLDNFVNRIDTTNIETEFAYLRKDLIKSGIEPITSFDENDKIEHVMYMANMKNR